MWCIVRSICLPVRGGESLGTLSLESELSELSKLKSIPERYCSQDSLTEAYLNSLSGTMLEPFRSKIPQHEAIFNGSLKGGRNSSFVAGSRNGLARTLALQENRLELAKRRAADCIAKSCESLTWLDPESCSWKTSQQSFLTGWEPFSQTFPRAGILHDGCVYELPMLARITTGIDGGCSPDGQTFHHTPNTSGLDGGSNSRKALAKRQEMFATPNTMDVLPNRSYEAMKRQATNGGRKNRQRPSNLREQIDPLMQQAYDEARAENNLVSNMQMWPTPSATDYKGSGKNGELRDRLDYAAERGATKSNVFATPQARDFRSGSQDRWENPDRSRNLNDQVATQENGKLNPRWVEWLQNWPLGHCLVGGTLSQTSEELPT